jgi:hypothetical protein
MAQTSSVKLDMAKIRELAKKDALGQGVLRALANRERARPVTDLRRLRQELIKDYGLLVNQEAFLSIFEELQRAGCGTLKVSRDPTIPARFSWTQSHVEISRVALGLTDTPPPAEGRRPQFGAVVGPPVGWIRIPYKIRDTIVNVDIPMDIKKDEAAGLTDLIKRFAT